MKQYRVPCSNLEYLVYIAKDGNAWGALIGENLQDGLCGFGETIPDALRALAADIEKHK